MLLGAGFTTRNMGVWALASGAISAALHFYENGKIYLLDYHYKRDSYEVRIQQGLTSVELINLRFSKKFWLPNNIARLVLYALLIRMIPSRAVRYRLISNNFWLRHIYSADILCSIAGGDSFSDIYGLNRLIYVVLPQLLVLCLNKPLVLLPQTIGPFKGKISGRIARYILSKAKIVYCREKNGLAEVSDRIDSGRDKISFCYDMGFILEPFIAEERKPAWITKLGDGDVLVGLNVSGLLYIGGYSHSNMFGMKVDYRRLIHELINHFIQKKSAHVMLVPHVFGAAENSESDVMACREIFRDSSRGLHGYLHLIDGDYNQHEIKALISKCDFFLGSRMHACIAALSQCIPSVGLAYSPKFRGVFASIGMEDLVTDLCEHDCSSVMETVDQAYERRTIFRSQLEAIMPMVKARIFQLFDFSSKHSP